MFADLTLAVLLEGAASKGGKRTCMVFGGREISYSELWERVKSLSHALEGLGLRAGDRVAIDLPNWPEFVESYFAASLVGALVVPVSTRLRDDEVKYVLGHSGASILITAATFAGHDYLAMAERMAPKLPELKHVLSVSRSPGEEERSIEGSSGRVPVRNYESLFGAPMAESGSIRKASPTDPALILYTSGTTGKPKGVTLSHRNAVWTAFNLNDVLQSTSSDRLLLVVPPAHVFGAVVGIVCTIASGGSMVLVDEFKAENVLSLIEREKCTLIFGTPTMYILLMRSPAFKGHDLKSLRSGMIAGAPCPVQVVSDIMEKMSCNVAIAYGLTETSPALTATRFDDPQPCRIETVGRALPGIELRVVDESRTKVPAGKAGELACRGYAVMGGYYREPDQTREMIDSNGWLYTGDIATRDEQGFIRIVGRKKDMIKRGGFAIFPAEVEDVLHTHPAIQEVAIVGVPDPVLGERSRAYVQLKEGARASEAEIIAFCRDRVADYKVVDQVRFVDRFPMTPSGKVRKADLPR